jgi:hypothetical protein
MERSVEDVEDNVSQKQHSQCVLDDDCEIRYYVGHG